MIQIITYVLLLFFILGVFNRKYNEANSSTEISNRPIISNALIVCSHICRSISSLIDLCSYMTKCLSKLSSNDIDHNDNTKSKEKSYFIDVLSECVDLLGLLVVVPSEDELSKANTGLGIAIAMTISTNNDVNPKSSSQVEKGIGVSTSDRWCLVSAIVDILRESVNTITNPNCQLPRRSLKAIGSIVTRAQPSMFNMLLAQQIPSALCECLVPAVGFDSSRNNDDDYYNNDNNSIKSNKFKQISAYATHSLALLLHTVGPQWLTTSAMPLECVLSGEGDRSSIDFELASERVMLGHRLCRLVTEKLIEGIGLRMNVLLRLLELVSHPEENLINANNSNSDSITSSTYSECSTLRSAVLRILTHTTVLNGRYLCSSITSYRRGSTIYTLLELVLDANSLDNNQYISHSPKRNNKIKDTDLLSKGLALIVLRNLIKSKCLSYKQLKICVNNTKICIEQNEDPRVLAAAFDLLSIIMTTSLQSLSNSNINTPSNNEYQEIEEIEPILMTKDELNSLTDSICQFVITTNIVSIISNLFYIIESQTDIVSNEKDNDDNDGTTISNANPRLWLLGSEFGHRYSGILDGLLSLLVNVAILNPKFSRITTVMNMTGDNEETIFLASIICKQLQSSCTSEISPIGLFSSLKFLSIFCNCNENIPDFELNSPLGSPTGRKISSIVDNFTSDTIKFARIESLIGLVSLVCLPQHLELCKLLLINFSVFLLLF